MFATIIIGLAAFLIVTSLKNNAASKIYNQSQAPAQSKMVAPNTPPTGTQGITWEENRKMQDVTQLAPVPPDYQNPSKVADPLQKRVNPATILLRPATLLFLLSIFSLIAFIPILLVLVLINHEKRMWTKRQTLLLGLASSLVLSTIVLFSLIVYFFN